jgi:hypothetical protein
MIDYHETLVTALAKILPTHHELVLHSGLPTPCISYMETNNFHTTEPLGATVGYSNITYQIKVWGNDIAQLQKYALEIDDALRPLGFKRGSCNELFDHQSTMIQKIMSYSVNAHEIY